MNLHMEEVAHQPTKYLFKSISIRINEFYLNAKFREDVVKLSVSSTIQIIRGKPCRSCSVIKTIMRDVN